MSGHSLVPLRDLILESQNGLSKRSGADGVDTPVLRLADITAGSIDESDPREIRLTAKELGKYALQDGDLVCIRVNGSKALVGRVIQFRANRVWAYCDHFIRLRPNQALVDHRYLAYYFNSQAVRLHIELNMVSSAGQNTVSQGTMLDIPVPCPALETQREIVAELEKQFSRLDEAVANLQRVKANLKRYKASVLKAAVEGRLVETEATLAHREARTYETGTQLLQRILEFRRSNLSAKGKLKEPAESRTTDQTELPEGWAWGTFGHLCQVQGGFAFKSNSYQPNGVPLVRISNLVNGLVQIGDNTVYLSEEFLKRFSDFRLQKGDTLIAMSGATTGKMATYTLDDSALLNQRVGRFRPVSASLLDVGYISLLAMQAGGKVLSDAYGAAQPNISPTEIEAIPVGVPPFSEQTRIVAEVDRHLSIIREVEAEVDANLKRAQALRQSTLAKAFGVEGRQI